ncbi:MAG TPA: NAD(P)/FAD-dependent oxidoreductase [Thermoplasmatales archaeon]|nr:NAD(P)/FAD-dependent oxidoreductase [Thermoplasmatales archaeon]
MKAVIVGGGPAGLITGLLLAQRSHRPLILEQQPSIQSTACAEGCDRASLEHLPFDVEPYVQNETAGAHIVFPGNNFFTVHIPGVVLDRTAWLRGLAAALERQGGTIRLNARVQRIREREVELDGGERVPFDVLVGADGPFSVVRKHLGFPVELICGVQYKLDGEAGDRYLRFYFDKRFSSHYAWVFPKRDSLNVGLAGKFSQLDAFLEHLDLNHCPRLERQAGGIPVSGVPPTIVKGRVALIGDAASMTNALSGGGLGPIIYAARMLADNIHRLRDYQRQVHRHPLAHADIVRGKNVLVSMSDRDLQKMGSLFNGMDLGQVRRRDMAGILRYPLLIRKFVVLGRGVQLTMRWGW